MNLLESSLIINQLLYQIYYQNNVFVFNKCIWDRIGWFIYTPNMVKKDYPHWCWERTHKTKQ